MTFYPEDTRVPPKRRYLSANLHGITPQNILIVTYTTVRTSNCTFIHKAMNLVKAKFKETISAFKSTKLGSISGSKRLVYTEKIGLMISCTEAVHFMF
jgi:hypothetical protein